MAGELRTGLNQPMLCAQFECQSLKNGLSSHAHRQAEHFRTEHIGIAVDNESRETVGFSVNQSVTVRDRIELKNIAAERERTVQ